MADTPSIYQLNKLNEEKDRALNDYLKQTGKTRLDVFNEGIGSVLQRAQVNRTASSEREAVEVAKDLGAGALNVVGTPIVAAAGLAAGAVMDTAEGITTGKWDTNRVREGLSAAADFSKELSDAESPVLKAKRERVQYKVQDTADRLGDNVLSRTWGTIDAYLEDPTLIAQDIISSAPALGIGKVARGITGAALESRVPASVARLAAMKPTSEAARNIAVWENRLNKAGVGALSGGMETLPTIAESYQDMVDNGVNPQEAMSQAFKTGVAQFGVTAVLGAGVSNFDLNLLKASGRGAIGKNIRNAIDITGEALQEGAENASSNIAENWNKKQTYNPGQDMTEGLGEAIGAGMVTGAGTTLGMRSPSIAWNAAGSVLNGLGKATSLLGDKNIQGKINTKAESGRTKAKQYRAENDQNIDPMDADEDSILNTSDYGLKEPVSLDPVEQAAVAQDIAGTQDLNPRSRVLATAQAMKSADDVNSDDTISEGIKDAINSGNESLLSSLDDESINETVESIVNDALTENEDGKTNLGVSPIESLALASKALFLGDVSDETLDKLDIAFSSKRVDPNIGDASRNRITKGQEIIRAMREQRKLMNEHRDAISSLPVKNVTAEQVSEEARRSGHHSFAKSTGADQKLTKLNSHLANNDLKRAILAAKDLFRYYSQGVERVNKLKEGLEELSKDSNPNASKEVVIDNYNTKRDSETRKWVLHKNNPESLAVIDYAEADSNYIANVTALAKRGLEGVLTKEQIEDIFKTAIHEGKSTTYTVSKGTNKKPVVDKKRQKQIDAMKKAVEVIKKRKEELSKTNFVQALHKRATNASNMLKGMTQEQREAHPHQVKQLQAIIGQIKDEILEIRGKGAEPNEDNKTKTETVSSIKKAISNLFKRQLNDRVEIHSTLEEAFKKAGVNPDNIKNAQFSYAHTQRLEGRSVKEFATAINGKLDIDGLPYIKNETKTDKDVQKIADKFLEDISRNGSLLTTAVKKLSYDAYLMDEETGEKISPDDVFEHWRLSRTGLLVVDAIKDGRIDEVIENEKMQITKERAESISKIAGILDNLVAADAIDSVEAARALIAASKFSAVTTENADGTYVTKVVEIGNNRATPEMSYDMGVALVKNLRKGMRLKEAFGEASKSETIKAIEKDKKEGKSGWVVFKKNSDPALLNAAAKGTGWCTGWDNLQYANSQIQTGDFWIYYDNGQAQVAIQTENGKVHPDQGPAGRLEGQKVAPKYSNVVRDFISNSGNIVEGEQYIKEKETFKSLMQAIKNKTPLSKEEAQAYQTVEIDGENEITYKLTLPKNLLQALPVSLRRSLKNPEGSVLYGLNVAKNTIDISGSGMEFPIKNGVVNGKLIIKQDSSLLKEIKEVTDYILVPSDFGGKSDFILLRSDFGGKSVDLPELTKATEIVSTHAAVKAEKLKEATEIYTPELYAPNLVKVEKVLNITLMDGENNDLSSLEEVNRLVLWSSTAVFPKLGKTSELLIKSGVNLDIQVPSLASVGTLVISGRVDNPATIRNTKLFKKELEKAYKALDTFNKDKTKPNWAALSDLYDNLFPVITQEQRQELIKSNVNDDFYHWDEEIPFSFNDDGQVQGFVFNGKVHLIASNIAEGNAKGVLMHEFGEHLGNMEEVLGPHYQQLLHTLSSWETGDNKDAREIALLARERSRGDDKERIAYAIEEAVNRGYTPTGTGIIGKWLNIVYNAFKEAFAKLSITPNAFTPQDLVNLAHGTALSVKPSNYAQLKKAMLLKGTKRKTPVNPEQGTLDLGGKTEETEENAQEDIDPIMAAISDMGIENTEVAEDASIHEKNVAKNWIRAFVRPVTKNSVFRNTFNIIATLKEGDAKERKTHDFLQHFAKLMNSQLNQFMTAEVRNSLEAGKYHNALKHVGTYHFTETVTLPDGTKRVQYNKKMLETMAITALQFLKEGAHFDYKHGLQDKGQPLPAMKPEEAVATIAGMLKANLGANLDTSVDDTLVNGPINAIASDIIAGLVTVNKGTSKIPDVKGMGWMDAVVIKNPGSTSSIVYLVPTELFNERIDAKNTTVESIRSMHTALSKYADFSKSSVRAWTSEPQKASNKVRHSFYAESSEKQIDAMNNMGKVPYYVNTSVTNIISNIFNGKDKLSKQVVDLISGAKTSSKATDEYKAKQEAKRRNIKAALEEVEDILVANDNDTNKPIYWKHQKVHGERSMMGGGVTPQGNTFMRQMTGHVRRTLSLNKIPYGVYFAWGQALGVKIDITEKSEIIAKVRAKTTDNPLFVEAVGELVEFRKNEKGSLNKVKEYLLSLDSDLIPDSITVLNDFANMREAINNEPSLKNQQSKWGLYKEGDVKFEINSYLEIDGKTDGFANAFQLFARKSDSTLKYEFFSGLFVGMAGKILSDVQGFMKDNFGAVDAYEASANNMIGEWLKSMTPSINSEVMALNHVLNRAGYTKQIDPDQGDGIDNIASTRNAFKQVTTAGGYLEGARSRKNTIINVIYETIEDILNAEGEVSPADRVAIAKVLDISANHRMFSDPNQFNEGFKKKISYSLYKTKYVESMEKVMKPLLDTIQPSLGILVDYSKICTEVAYHAFEEEMRRLIQEGLEKGEITEKSGIPLDYTTKALKSITHLLPVLTTTYSPETGIGIVKTQNDNDSKYTAVIRGVAGKYSSKLTVKQLMNPDTAAGALTVIGGGDASMMYQFFQDYVQALNTYDGAQIDPTEVEKHNETLNQASFDNWQNNTTIEDAIKHLEKLEELIPDSMDLEELFGKDVHDDGGEILYSRLASRKQALPTDSPFLKKGYKSQGPNSGYMSTLNGLRYLANEVKINREIRSQMNSSMNHMAASLKPMQVGNPKGRTSESIRTIKQEYSRVIREARANNKLDNQEENLGENYKENPQFRTAIKNNAKSKMDGTYVLDAEGITNVLDNLKFESPILKTLWQKVIKPLLPKDLQITYSTDRKVISKKVSELGYGYSEWNEAISFNNQIFITTLNPRVLMHELFHASTAHITTRYFNDGLKEAKGEEGYYKNQRIAMYNMVKLLKDALGSREEISKDPYGKGFFDVIDDIMGNVDFDDLTPMKKSIVMQEVFAHIMTSKRLTEVATKIQSKSNPFTKFKDSMKIWYKRMLGIPEGQGMESLVVQMIEASKRLSYASTIDEGEVAYLRKDGVSLNSLDILNRSEVQTPIKEKMGNIINALTIRSERIPANSQMKKVNADRRITELRTAQVAALETSVNLSKNGLGFNDPEQTLTFEAIHALVSSPGLLGVEFIRTANEIHSRVMKEGFEILRNNNDPKDTVDIKAAKRRFNYLQKDRNGAVTLMAYAIVNPALRNRINDLYFDARKDESKKDKVLNGAVKGLDTVLRNIYIDGQSVGEVLDQVSARLEATNELNLIKSIRPENLLIKASDKVTEITQNAGEKINRASEDIAKNGNELTSYVMKGVAAMLNNEAANEFAEDTLNHVVALPMATFVKQLFKDVVGTTDRNYDLLALFSRFKSGIEEVRNNLSRAISQTVKSEFENLSKDHSKSITKAVINTNLGVFDNATAKDILKNPSKIKDMIKEREAMIKSSYKARILEYSEQLGIFMQNGQGTVKLKNANAISGYFEIPKQSKIINELITLHSLEAMTQEDRDSLIELSHTESKGLDAIINMQRELTKEESKKDSGNNDYNRISGYSFRQRNFNKGLVIAESSSIQEMRRLGWFPVGEFKRSPADKGPSLTYFASTTASKPSYSSGLIHKIEQTAGGTSKYGKSRIPNLSSSVGDSVAVLELQKLFDAGKLPKGYVPVFSRDSNEIVDFERQFDPELVSSMLEQEEQAHVILGQWRARQVEEQMSQEMNKKGAEFLAKYHEDKGASMKFVDIADPNTKNRVIKDIWKSMPYENRVALIKAFDMDGRVMVPETYIAEAVGIRAASVKDIWSGTSNLDPKIRNGLEYIATAMFGEGRAYKYLSNTEEVWMGTVSKIRQQIIVKTGTVAAENAASSLIQGTRLGISPMVFAKAYGSKWKETSQYLRMNARINELKARQLSNPSQKTVYQREINRLEDTIKRLSIYPLIEAGEFSLTPEGLDDSEQYGLISNFDAWVGKQVDKLPITAQNIGKNIFITEDTMLYKGLNRFVMFGDFTAKSVMYDIMKEKGDKTDKEILQVIQDEFVNYKMHPGRTRGFLEGLGIFNFWNFKLRSIKGIFRMMRDNPFMAILTSMMGNAVDVDTLSDAAAWNTSYTTSNPMMLVRGSSNNLWTWLFE